MPYINSARPTRTFCQSAITPDHHTPKGSAAAIHQVAMQQQSLAHRAQEAYSQGLFGSARKIAGQITAETLRTSVLTRIQNATLAGIGHACSPHIKRGPLTDLVTLQETEKFEHLEQQAKQEADAEQVSAVLKLMTLVQATGKSNERFRYNSDLSTIKALVFQAQKLTQQISDPATKEKACNEIDRAVSLKIDVLCENKFFATAKDLSRMIHNKEMRDSKLRDIASKQRKQGHSTPATKAPVATKTPAVNDKLIPSNVSTLRRLNHPHLASNLARAIGTKEIRDTKPRSIEEIQARLHNIEAPRASKLHATAFKKEEKKPTVAARTPKKPVTINPLEALRPKPTNPAPVIRKPLTAPKASVQAPAQRKPVAAKPLNALDSRPRWR